MRRKIISLSLLAFLGFGGLVMAQVTGVVNDADGLPEIDAEVVVKGTGKVAITDENGNFTIDAKVGDVLVIDGKEFVVKSNNLGVLKKSSPNDNVDLSEVVVLGYGLTSTKPKSNAASVTVGSETLDNRPNVSVLSSLQGTAPGISINSSSGSPGSGRIDVKIRGVNSLQASLDPLYVIDGVVTSSTQFRNLNSEDIENISILKDAQATSIYGNRGSNGVVVINTKAGKFNSGLQIDYSALTSVSQFPEDHYNLANSDQYLRIQRSSGYNNLTDAQIAANTVNTNWKREFFREVGFNQQHTLGLRFGGETVNAYTSLGYLENQGNIKSTDFKRFTFRNNINGRSKDRRLTYNTQVALGYSTRNQLDEETNTNINTNIIQNPLLGIIGRPDLAPQRFANGREMFNRIGRDFSQGRNPWVLQDVINGGIVNRFAETTVFGAVDVRYALTEDLSIGNRFGVDYRNGVRNFARTPNGYLSVVVADNAGQEFGGSETIVNVYDLTLNNVVDLNYTKKLGDHTLSATAFFEYTRVNYQVSNQTQNGLDPLNWSLGAGTGYVPFNENNPNQYRPRISASKLVGGTLAYFANVDYDFAGKYGLSATVRRDGSYRFRPENRWENFWSASARWNIDKEAFMDGSNFRLLKLRASLGTTGNQNLIQATNNSNPLLTGATLARQLYATNSAYQGEFGFRLGSLIADNLRWEVTRQGNIGLDFDYKGKLTGSVDVYHKKTNRLYNIINLSPIEGASTVRGNNGEMVNQGIEGLLRYNVIDNKDVQFSVFVNTGYNYNKILVADNPDLANDIVNAVGGPASQWQLYRYVGVNPETGEQQYLDRNGNITESPQDADRVLTGKTPIAPWTGGFGFNSSYKGIFLDVLFSFQQGGWAYDNMYDWLVTPSYTAETNISADLLNAWTPENRQTNIPSLRAQNAGTEGGSDRFLYRTDFIRLKNITLGYNFSSKDLDRVNIKSLRLFVTGENILTWTSWRGFDPEPIRNFSLGIYPNPQVYSIGLNVGF